MEEGFREYRKVATVMAKQMAEDFKVETVNGPSAGKAGDYLCVSPFGDEWPCRRDLFEASYVPVAPPDVVPHKAQIHDQGFKVPCSMVFCSNWTSLYIGVKDCHGEHRINICENCLENILRSGKKYRPDLYETLVVQVVDETTAEAGGQKDNGESELGEPHQPNSPPSSPANPKKGAATQRKQPKSRGKKK